MMTRGRDKRLLPAAVLLLLLTACASERGRTRLTWRDEPGPAGSADAPGEPRPASSSRGEGGVVRIPEEVMRDLMAFVNTQKVLIADRIEVDASRIPFQMALVPVFDPDYVQRVEVAVPGVNAKGLLLRTRARVPSVERDFPRLRLGDGIDLVATREIRTRTYSEVDRTRPVFLKIQARGHVVYRDESGRRIERDSLVLEASAVLRGETMVFRRSIY